MGFISDYWLMLFWVQIVSSVCNACAVDEIELQQQQRHVRTASSSTIHVAHAIAMWRTAHFTQQHQQQQQWQVDDFATAAPKPGFLFFAIFVK